jgi:hypothetical protein
MRGIATREEATRDGRARVDALDRVVVEGEGDADDDGRRGDWMGGWMNSERGV